MTKAAEITQLLQRSRTDPSARDAAYELIYSDLRRLAGHRIASARPGETLSVTSLVNEVYLKLVDRTGSQWNDRAHFLRVAARAMPRRISSVGPRLVPRRQRCGL